MRPCLSHSDCRGQQQSGLIMEAAVGLLFSFLTMGNISYYLTLTQNYASLWESPLSKEKLLSADILHWMLAENRSPFPKSSHHQAVVEFAGTFGAAPAPLVFRVSRFCFLCSLTVFLRPCLSQNLFSGLCSLLPSKFWLNASGSSCTPTHFPPNQGSALLYMKEGPVSAPSLL